MLSLPFLLYFLCLELPSPLISTRYAYTYLFKSHTSTVNHVIALYNTKLYVVHRLTHLCSSDWHNKGAWNCTSATNQRKLRDLELFKTWILKTIVPGQKLQISDYWFSSLQKKKKTLSSSTLLLCRVDQWQPLTLHRTARENNGGKKMGLFLLLRCPLEIWRLISLSLFSEQLPTN